VKHNGMATGETAGVFLVHIRICFLSFVAPPRLGFSMQYVFYREKEPGLLWKRWLAVKQSKAKQERKRFLHTS
jgi:hypothetical protein